MNGIQSYPLCWPAGWPRTSPSARRPGAFQVSFARARDELLDELRLLGASGVVISTDVPARKDGLPYAGRERGRTGDPGVAVYFARSGRAFVLACDRFAEVRDNLRAVGLTVQGLRAIERYGATELLERAFEGFAALPAPAAVDWRAELGFEAGARPDAIRINDRYRALARRAHPDAGGSDEAMRRLNRAREAALGEDGGGATR